MKKIISFEKNIEFPSMIGEITSISLDHNLEFKDESNIRGDLIVKGTYKRTEASRLEEEFEYSLPTEILLTEKLDLSTTSIEIDDFFYEIENDDTVKCHIDVAVDGMEIVEFNEEEFTELEHHEQKIEEIVKEDRECDGDNTYEEIEEQVEEEPEKEVANDEKIEEPSTKEVVGSLFSNLKDSDDTFSTYTVYIVREEETIDSIITKYKITKEELASYNDISDIKIGSKLIIPIHNEDN